VNPETRAKASGWCAAAGVLLMALATFLPADWYPAVPLFLGLALLGVSHFLTPCMDQITRWWRHRVLKQ
jgi:hypothetical protein